MNPKTEIDDAASREFEAIPLDPERLGKEPCGAYEMATTEDEAATCDRYEKENPDEDDYCPSSSAGDYSPSNPWDAPGMSI